MIRLIFSVSMFIMIFQVAGYAAAEETAFDEAHYTMPPLVGISELAASSERSFPDLGSRNTVETEEISKDPPQENKLNLPPGAWRQIEWAQSKNIGPQFLVDPVEGCHSIDDNPLFFRIRLEWRHKQPQQLERCFRPGRLHFKLS